MYLSRRLVPPKCLPWHPPLSSVYTKKLRTFPLIPFYEHDELVRLDVIFLCDVCEDRRDRYGYKFCCKLVDFSIVFCEKYLHSSPQSKYKIQSTFFLNIIIRK